MKKNGINRGNVTNIIVSSILIALLVILNIQTSAILDHFGSNVQPVTASAEAPVVPTAANSSMPDYDQTAELIAAQKQEFKTVKQQLENRTKIDDFLAADLWSGNTAASGQGSIMITSVNGEAEAHRKYDGLLDLKSYLYIDAEAKNLGPVSWMTLYLMEDLDFANYYEFNLREVLKEGANQLVINKKDFQIGSGTPKWNEICAIRIEYGTDKGVVSTLTLNEISTYDASPMCSIWFDDGWKNTYTDALPIMKEKNIKGILSVVGSYVDCPAYVSGDELAEIYNSGWDLVNHTDDHKDLTKLSTEEVRSEIISGYDYLESHGFTRAAGNVVPPYCATNEETDEVLSTVALTSRVIPSKYNYLPVTDPYHLGFREVFSDTSPETAMQWIDEAIDNDLWLVLLFHSIDSTTDSEQEYTKENFQKIINYLYEKQSEIKTVTLSEVLGADIIDVTEPKVQPLTNEEGMKLEWEEDFDSQVLNEQSWNIIEAAPFKNNELQTYNPDGIKVQNSMLEITSSKDGSGYLSGAVTTENKQLFQGGRIEIRAKLPSGKGIFPAIWMLPQSGDSFPEIDIIEFLGNDPDSIWHVMHYETNGNRQKCSFQSKGQKYDEGFHVYAFEWTDKGVKWLIDGAEVYSEDGYIPPDKMYLYINTAIGGDWPGAPDSTTQFPQTMLVDYIRYYR